MTLEQLESEILRLPPADFRKLADWIAARSRECLDREAEQDAAAFSLSHAATLYPEKDELV